MEPGPVRSKIIEGASCDYYERHGQMMPDNWFEQLKGFDAIYFGAVAGSYADHIRCGVRCRCPSRLRSICEHSPGAPVPGVLCSLAGREPGDIDFVVIRENTEGEYSSVGGRMFEGTENELILQESVFTRRGVDRILKYAF